ncbi:unnamed protein product [Ceutorhynchus assimilis]|uniref:C2H2-type domain-containing protein n=1 Tax=Ceutorhynchus assimilis TaxID=467358 RepID=A0A9N9QT68_9CUCU|nr:unnamed protein product [Ceutorhynchus assimilis]
MRPIYIHMSRGRTKTNRWRPLETSFVMARPLDPSLLKGVFFMYQNSAKSCFGLSSLGLPVPLSSAVGPNGKEAASDEKLDEPSGSSTQPNPDPFQCQLCPRKFGTKTGLGVHMRRAHLDELDRQQARVDVKARWTDEEMH